jgi:predicted short-subunit dehydrogenase-like oxidoreductase (DUF2520 family)
VGTAVTKLLIEAGHTCVGVASRSATSAETAAGFLDAPILALAEDRWNEADVILIGASDDAVAGVADGLVPLIAPGSVVCHFAGTYGTELLGSVIEAGAFACAMHPVQACPDVGAALRNLPGSVWGVTAEPAVTRWATTLIDADLQGRAVAVPEEARPLWHAAAVTTSNGIAALLSLGEAILASIGLEEIDVLGPLAMGTVANARSGGGGAATLTGPVVRGESSALAGHLAALAETAPQLVPLYSQIQLLVLDRAVAAGRLDEDRAATIRAILQAGA